MIFSDESGLCQTSDCGWVRFRRGEWNRIALRWRRKFPDGLMVWGALGMNVRSSLLMCARSIDAAEYLAIVQRSGIVEMCDAGMGEGNGG
jgi:hypothetical protein